MGDQRLAKPRRANQRLRQLVAPTPGKARFRGLGRTLLILSLAFATFVTTFGLFEPLSQYDFVNFDDGLYVAENPRVLSGLSWPNFRWALTTSHAANWHPLTWWSLMLDADRYRPSDSSIPAAGGFHRTSVSIHAANGMLLLLALIRLSGAIWPSLLVALLFAWHPTHVESVAWISERKDVLSTFFGFAALWFYAGYTRRGGSIRYGAVVASLTLSLLAKQMLVTLPFLLLLLDYWPLGRWSPFEHPLAEGREAISLRRLIVEKLPLLLLCLLMAAVTAWAQSEGQAVRSFEKYPIGERIANAALAYVAYIEQTLLPSGLAFYYPRPPGGTPLGAASAAGALLLVLCAFALIGARRFPFLAVGWFWFLGTLVPVIGLVTIGDQAYADRYTYFPAIGLYLIGAWSLAQFVASAATSRSRWARRAGATLVAGVSLFLCAALSGEQIKTWQNNETLFRHAIAVTQANEVAHNQLGNAYKDLGRFEDAAKEYRAALEIRPNAAEYHSNLGSVLLSQGKTPDALVHFEEAIRARPDWAFVRNNRAWVLATSADDAIRDSEAAVAEAEKACSLDGANPAFLDTLAAAYAAAGRYADAERTIERAIGLAESARLDSLVPELRARLDLYRAGKPFRDAPP